MPPSSPFSRIKSGFHPWAMVKYHRNYRKACTGLGRKFHDQNTVRMPRQYLEKSWKSLIYQWFCGSNRWLLHHDYTIFESALM